ncbi:MAG: Maf family protein [Desulfotalea sp.]
MYLTKRNIILASSSPRRQRFFKDLGLKFKVVPPNVDEDQLDETGYDFVSRLAKEKGLNVSVKHPSYWVVAADTIVCYDDIILGKPISDVEASEFLMLLSGSNHQVMTSYSICQNGSVKVNNTVTTNVQFAALSTEFVQAYIKTREPFDKAGGYGIQGLGASMIKKIEGSYTNVVGLPMAELITDLLELKIITVG